MLAPASIYTTALIASLVALGPLSTDMYLPAFPALKAAFSADIDQVQRTLSVFMLGFALAQLVYGPLSDRFGRKPVLAAGIGLFFLSSLGILFARSIEELTLLRLLQAIGGSAGPVLGRAMVRDIHGPRESARLLSYIATAMALAPAAAPVLGGFMTVWFGWSSIFLFLACYGLLGLVLLQLLVPETAPRIDRPSIAWSTGTPAASQNVGNRSMSMAIWWLVCPAAILPGHMAQHGTRIPPSYMSVLPPRSGPLQAPAGIQPPLSDENTTRVSASARASRRAVRTWPIPWSMCSTRAM